MESWVRDGIDTDLNMALFDVHDSVLDRLCHLHFLHENGKTTSSKGTDVDLLAGGQSLSTIDDSHLVQLLGHLLGFGNTVVVLGAQSLELSYQFGDLADQLIVLDVVFTILHVIASQNSDLSQT